MAQVVRALGERRGLLGGREPDGASLLPPRADRVPGYWLTAYGDLDSARPSVGDKQAAVRANGHYSMWRSSSVHSAGDAGTSRTAFRDLCLRPRSSMVSSMSPELSLISTVAPMRWSQPQSPFLAGRSYSSSVKCNASSDGSATKWRVSARPICARGL